MKNNKLLTKKKSAFLFLCDLYLKNLLCVIILAIIFHRRTFARFLILFVKFYLSFSLSLILLLSLFHQYNKM